MANRVAKVKRETIAACMTCPICNNIFEEATTMCECLHTFCRKCIYDKITEEEIENCPVCNIDLGCAPLEKLRPDHNLQDVRAKIFPLKGRKVEAPEVVPEPEISPPATVPARRKERSLSQLVVNAPKVSTQATSGKRIRANAKKAAALRILNGKSAKKEEDSEDDNQESESSSEILNKFSQNRRQHSSSAEPSQPKNNIESETHRESWEGKPDLWKPLNCLVEVANRTKSFKSNSQGSESKLERASVRDIEALLGKTRLNEDKSKQNFEDDKNITDPTSENLTPKKLRRNRRKKPVAIETPGILSPQAVLDATSDRQERRHGPVWFSLVASEDQEGESPLPQIAPSYLRIKEGNIPVLFIQKYLMKKLDLASEAEVEIKCMGQPVDPTMQLYNLIDSWLQTASASQQRIEATVGASAKDFVMVLGYARKAPADQ